MQSELRPRRRVPAAPGPNGRSPQEDRGRLGAPPTSPAKQDTWSARLPGRGEKLFTVFVLLLSTGAFMNLFGNDEPNLSIGAGSLFMQAIWSLIYLITFILLLRNCQGFVALVVRERLLIFLLTLAAVSVVWSDAPWITFRRSVALMGTTLFGVYFTFRFTLADQLKLLSHMLVCAAILSLLFVLVLPAYGIGTGGFEGGWQGIYGHKNVLGITMALGVVVFTLRAISAGVGSLAWWAAAALALILLLRSNSVSGLLACLFSFCALILSFAFRWRLKRAVLFFLGVAALAVAAGVYLINHMDEFISALGRNPSLSGRTTIWLLSAVSIKRHPWLGYGYSAFWRGFGSPSEFIWRVTGFPASHAHNAILNLWLDIGLAGVLIFALQYLRSVWGAITLARRTTTVQWLWPLVFLAFIGIYSLDESVILQQNNLTWILYTAMLLLISASRAAQPPRAALAIQKKHAT